MESRSDVVDSPLDVCPPTESASLCPSSGNPSQSLAEPPVGKSKKRVRGQGSTEKYTIHPLPIRKLVIKLLEDGKSIRDTAATLRVPKSSVHSILKIYRSTSELTPKKRGGNCVIKVFPEHKEAIQKWFHEDCFMTLKKAAERLEMEYGLKVSLTTVSRIVHSYGFTTKAAKSVSTERKWQANIKGKR
eukprot:TRINITY_DN110_c0_g1_i3.p1 TRINITY_DN110_c0_g1~~TRINITY_DN110_c0_g1_i3.p1  ORF type:complete len:188 (-),score=29.23 TRINITY_DN110_c0_g1_i3:630-1193(-)